MREKEGETHFLVLLYVVLVECRAVKFCANDGAGVFTHSRLDGQFLGGYLRWTVIHTFSFVEELIIFIWILLVQHSRTLVVSAFTWTWRRAEIFEAVLDKIPFSWDGRPTQ